MKEALTVGQIAKALGVGVRTVANMIDSGELKALKTAGTKHRRVHCSEFHQFLVKRGLPIPPEMVDGPTFFPGRTTAEMCANLQAFATRQPYDAEKLRADCLAVTQAYQTLELTLKERA